jgi:hypothetical protein
VDKVTERAFVGTTKFVDNEHRTLLIAGGLMENLDVLESLVSGSGERTG